MLQHCQTYGPRTGRSGAQNVSQDVKAMVEGGTARRVHALLAWMAGGLVALVALCTTAPVARAQGVGFVLTPAAERIQWDDDLAFEDDWMYGGRLGLLFGHQVELQPYYFFRKKYPIDAGRAASVFGPASAGREIDLRHYGANLQLNLARGDFVPFIRGGGGLLELRPDSGERHKRITISAGGGLRFAIGGASAEVYAQQMAFRLNPLNVFGVDSLSTGVSPTRRNIVYGAAVSLPLSSMSDADEFDEGLHGTTAPIEPFVGQLRYSSDVGLNDQDLAGIRAGIDFSQQVGLRGFYWRGVNDDHDGTDPVTGYGGEVQLNLNSGPGISPYLILGGGRIDYGDDFRDPDGNAREDEGVLIAGGGASLRLTDRLRLNAAVRDYIMTRESTLSDATSTDDLTHNTMITAGLSISIGGSSGPSTREMELQREREALDRRRRQLAAREREAREQAMRRDSLMDARMESQRRLSRDERDDRRDDRAYDDRDADDSTGRDMRRDGATRRRGDARVMTVPVPEVGEVILRYGMTPAGSTSTTTGTTTTPMSISGLSTMDLRRLIRDELERDSSNDAQRNAATPRPRTATDSSTATTGTSVDDARLARIEALEAELQRRLDEMQRLEVERRNAAPSPANVPTPTVVTDSSVEVERASTPVFQRLGRTSTRDLRPFLGFGGDDDVQAVASLRADLGPLSPGSAFRFAPELALGFGGGSTSVLALANVQYPFGSIGGSAAIRPYVTLGGGIFSPSVLAVNTAVGASFVVGSTGRSPLYTFVEVQGLNLFDYTRLMFGISSRR